LLNPTKPKKLAMNSNIIEDNGAVSKSPLYIYSSLVNFIDPGIPAYNTFINNRDKPKLGVVCNTPDISETRRDLYLLWMQSTKKNIKDERRE
jgi:hypothetical protein